MVQSKIKSYAKINLALNVIGKKSALHQIESIITFVLLSDDIIIKKINSDSHKIYFCGKFYLIDGNYQKIEDLEQYTLPILKQRLGQHLGE